MKYLYWLGGLITSLSVLFIWLFTTNQSPSDFMPHGMCFYWRPEILYYSVIGSALISFSYFVIPGFIYAFYKYKKEALNKARPLFMVFASFIICCGIGHILKVYNIWFGEYELEALWDLITGAVSLMTVIVLVNSFSSILKLPTAEDVKKQFLIADLHRKSSIDGVVVHEHGVIREINEPALQMFNMTRKQVINTAPLMTLVSAEDARLVQERIENKEQGLYNLTILPKNKTPVYTLVNSYEIDDDGKSVRVTVLRDITELVELRTQNERLKTNISSLEEIKSLKKKIVDELTQKGN